MRAFNGDLALRSEALDRLNTHAAADRVRPGPLAYAQGTGSVVGCLIESDDLDVWESRLGLPKWLALAIDALAAGRSTLEASVQAGTDTVGATRPGSDVSRVGSRFIGFLLDDVVGSLAPAALPVEVEHARRRLAALQARSLAGEDVPADEWRALRRVATALTDGAGDAAVESFCRCLEAAAWDPVRSRTAVLDTLRAWQDALDKRAALEFGWGAADNVRTQSLLERVRTDHPDDARHVSELFAQFHPEDAARVGEMRAFRRLAGDADVRRAVGMLAKLLGAAA